MEVTIIGAIDIILSIYAFLRKENMLIGLVAFFSVFTAAMAVNIGTPISLVEIPMILWIVKQGINLLRNIKKITKNDIKDIFKNKFFVATVIFIIVVIFSEIFLAISKVNFYTYDASIRDFKNIRFNFHNISQSLRILLILVFISTLSIKKLDKIELKKIIETFVIGCLFVIAWGYIQYFIFAFKISYPAYLFNNDPYVAQGFNQYIHNLKRISSISTEPSICAFTLLAVLPLLVMKWQKQNNSKKKNFLIIILSIICGFLTTSSTFYFGIVFLSGLYGLIILFNKDNKLKQKIIKIIKIIVILVISFGIALVLLITPVLISNIVEKNCREDTTKSKNIDYVEDVKEKNKEELKVFKNTINEMTVNKANSGSGNERFTQNKTALQIFAKYPILGVGYGSYRPFAMFINILANMGILGLISILYLLYVVISKILDNYDKEKTFAIALLLSIVTMIFCFSISIPDMIYLFFWLILVVGYKYFSISDDRKKNKKIIGIDARALDGKRTGIATYIEQIILQLNKKENDENEYILYSCRDINLDFELKNNIKKKVCNAKIGTIWLLKDLPKTLYEDNVDIFWGTQHVLPLRNIYTEDIKYVLTVHDLANLKLKHIGQLKNEIVQKLFVGNSCKIADKIISVSESTKKDINEIIGIKLDKIETVYLGTNLSTDYELDSKKENEILEKFEVKDKNYLFFISTIEPRKNISTLVKAFNILKDNKKFKGLKLVLAGGLGWRYEPILQEIDNSKYKKDIIRPGYISNEEKKCLLHNCKAFTYPSLYEGFGLPILEAFANKAIVVTSNISSIPEVGGDSALYFNNVLDENELSKIIEKALIMDAKEKNKRINEGTKLTKEFTWEKCAKETLNILISE